MHAYNGVLTILGSCVLCFCKGQATVLLLCVCVHSA